MSCLIVACCLLIVACLTQQIRRFVFLSFILSFFPSSLAGSLVIGVYTFGLVESRSRKFTHPKEHQYLVITQGSKMGSKRFRSDRCSAMCPGLRDGLFVVLAVRDVQY